MCAMHPGEIPELPGLSRVTAYLVTEGPSMKKPDNRSPFDPAKAMRERNLREAPEPVALTLKQRMAMKRPLLRPEAPKATDSK